MFSFRNAGRVWLAVQNGDSGDKTNLSQVDFTSRERTACETWQIKKLTYLVTEAKCGQLFYENVYNIEYLEATAIQSTLKPMRMDKFYKQLV